ncbi:MAG: C-terminal target protein [Bacteroidota bacterium]|nr:C-terminal target protein [Bacteroidota bacterium]
MACMKKYYRFVRYFILFSFFTIACNYSYAQKNIKLRILTIASANSSGTDCDYSCICCSNSPIDWVYDIDDGGTDVDEACYDAGDDQNSNSVSPGFLAWNRNYDGSCQWPGGNIDFNVEGWDQDCADLCIGGGFGATVSDLVCRVNVNRAWPSTTNGTYGPFTATCTYNSNYNGSGNCAGTITVTYQWEVTGNFVYPAPANDNICSAIDLGVVNGGYNSGALNFNNICASNQGGEPRSSPTGMYNTVWYKFTTPATNVPARININISENGAGANNSALTLYEGSSCAFGSLIEKDFNWWCNSSGGSIKGNCLAPNKTYYIQAGTAYNSNDNVICVFSSESTGSYSVSVDAPNISAGPDLICNAYDLGTFSNNAGLSLDVYNQTNRCASVGGCEPDDMPGSLDKTVWYKFTTPPPYYSDGTLPNLYTVEIERTGGGAFDHIPAYTLWKQTAATVRTCSPENCASFANLSSLGSEAWTSIGNTLRNLCLEPNTTYYIQVDHNCTTCFFGIDDYVEFNVHVKKSAYRPPNNICDALDLGYITSNGTASGTATNINWNNSNKFSAAPFLGLPHSNRCKSTESGEPNATLGQDETVWYKFTTGNNAPDYIDWYETDGTCAAPGLLSSFFNSEVEFYKSNSTAACPVGTNLDLQPEKLLSGETCLAGIGTGAPCYRDEFRLKCPEPNTTYWVQIQAASFSVCEEGLWYFDNQSGKGWIKTAPTLNAGNPWDEPCTAFNMGTVPNSGTLTTMPGTGYMDNFCATARQEFRADFNQPLERDVWIKFKPPSSGSVRVTAQSAPSGSPGLDNDLDIQMALWEPVLGSNINDHCGDLRYLWTPRLAQDHGIQEATEAGVITTAYYDIYNTCGNSILCNEGNSFIVPCLDPTKTYFLQVDGGKYFGCDLLDAGDCIMGYFKVQIADAGLGSIDPSAPTNYNTGNPPNFTNDEPCFARLLTVDPQAGPINWKLMTNRCATSINDPIPARWQSVNSSTDNTVWASFIAPASGRVKIRAENIGQIKGDADWHDDINLQLEVYNDFYCFDKAQAREVQTFNESGFDGALTEANPASDEYVGVCVCIVDATCGYDEYYTVKCLIPGQKYYIMIDGDAGYTCNTNAEDVLGDFRISVQDLGGGSRSVNDSVCNAYEILGTATMPVNGTITTGNFNNECATIQPLIEGPGKVAEKISDDDIILPFTITVEHTLWFKFKAPSSGSILIEGKNTGLDNIDIGMALYDFPFENCANAAAGIKVAQDYDAGTVGFNIDEDFYVECLVPGRYYYLQVDGDRNAVYNPLDPNGTETGEFYLKLTHQSMGSRADQPPQNNDSLCDAINFGTISNGGSVFRNDDNNRCATSEQNEPNISGWNVSYFAAQDRTVWYTFTTGANPGAINIAVTDPKPNICFDVDIDLFEYTGTYTTSACDAMALTNSQFNPLFRVANGDIAGIGQSETVTLPCPKPNQQYFLRVTGSGGVLCAGFGPDQGTFDVSISVANSPAILPPNDNVCNAANMGILGNGTTLTLNNQNNNCATQELNEPNTSQSCLADQSCYDETVWYYFTTSATPGQVTINMDVVGNAIADFYGNVSLFEALAIPAVCSFTNLDYMIQSLPFSNGFHDAQITAPCLKPYTTYYLQCDGWDVGPLGLVGVNEQGVFNITVNDNGAGFSRATNDNLANALPVQSGTLAAGGTLTVSSHNKCATCENNEPGGLSFCGTSGTGHTALLNAEDETVWFYFTTPLKPGLTTVTVADDPAVSGTFSPNFRIYYNNGTSPFYRITGAPSGRLIQEGSSATGISSASNTYTCLLPNTKYWVQVDGNDVVPGTVDQSNFILTVADDGSGNPGPSNDLICNATGITIPANGSVATNSTNKCSWEEIGEPNTSGNMGGTGDNVTADNYDETVWYSFIPPSDGIVTLNNLSVGYNYVLYEMPGTATITGCPDPVWSQLREIASGTASIASLTESWSCLDDAKRYYLQIDGNDNPVSADVGNFSFTLSHTGNTIVGNDMICGATNWGTVTAAGASSTSQNNQCATEECGEPSVSGNCHDLTALGYDKTLWYKFTANAVKGNYVVTVANNGVPTDLLAPSISIYRQNATVCPVATPNFSNLNLVKQNLNIAASTASQSVSLNCWEIEPNKTYYIQVDGNDLNETGNNFNVSITYAATPVPNDDICNAVPLTIGAAPVAGDNTCAGTQANELNLSPSAPQDPTVSGYDETVWYSFIAPPSGAARVTFGGLGVLAVGLNIDLNVLEAPAGNPAISCAAPNQFTGLANNSSTTIPRNNLATTHDLTCLIPGRKYYLQVDGSDASIVDRGSFTVAVSDLDPTFVAGSTVPNDDPCGAIDITQFIRTDIQGPCPSNTSSYTGQYTVTGGSPNIDRATRSSQGGPCNGLNCSDYWFKFTVPNDAYGIRVQGDEQNESVNHTENVTIYRPSGNCSGTMNEVSCGSGGFFGDVDYSIAAAPGETLYLSVHNSAGVMGTAPATSANNFGLCLSPVCPAKPTCLPATLIYDQPQCWNMDVDGANLGALYYDCLPGSNNSANYFVFNTDCGVNGFDTVTMVFSVTDIGGSSIFCGTQTAMSIFEDATPCDGNPQNTLLNCVVWEDVTGGSTASNVVQTWVLGECKTYVVQIISNQNDGDCASGGQIVIFQSILIPTQVLPVELTSFTGYNDGNINVLNWITASEMNTLKFVVEKSIDGENFTYIGERPAAGNSYVPLHYTLDDPYPVVGKNYYRLKMIDKDGQFKYSEKILIKVYSTSANTDGIVRIYPNPANDKINIVYQAGADQRLDLDIFNAIGQNMHQSIHEMNAGLITLTVDVTDYAKGMYIINLQNKTNGNKFQSRFIKE